MMNSTRDRILQTLLNSPQATISDLATAVGINVISVRHHLTQLQLEGLVTAEEERHGIGRPRLIYKLTDKGIERFPSRYMQLTNRLIDQIKENLPPSALHDLFGSVATSMADEYASELKPLPLEQKLIRMKELLAQEGYCMEWEKDNDQYVIHEITCPYYHIGQSHPEVCLVDQKLLSSMLSLPVNRVRCILSGDTNCTYHVQEKSL